MQTVNTYMNMLGRNPRNQMQYTPLMTEEKHESKHKKKSVIGETAQFK